MPSFFPYDLRAKRERFPKWVVVLAVLFYAALAIDTFMLSASASEKEIIDDKAICSSIHQYPIEQHEAILDYCVGLMERGL